MGKPRPKAISPRGFPENELLILKQAVETKNPLQKNFMG